MQAIQLMEVHETLYSRYLQIFCPGAANVVAQQLEGRK